MIIIADHGNIESTGEYQKNGKTLTDTEHNPSPVPCIIVNQKYTTKNFNPELRTSKIISNLQNLGINIDQNLLTKTILINNCQDYSSQWISKAQIEVFGSNSLPLWYSGALLLGLE
jgi:Metalloenzyme superfamily